MDARAEERNAFNFRMSEIYNFNTDKIEQSDFWLLQDEETLFQLRYSLRTERKAYGCPVCKTPVSLLRSTNQNWFFRHLPREEGVKCAIVDEHMPLSERRIQKYNAAKETDEHKDLKNFIGRYLSNDPNVIGRPEIEKILKGTYTPTRWKRPDVSCRYGAWNVVFEVQISNTWLSDIVERDSFYAKNKTIIIWVFNSFNSCRPAEDATKADIFYNNPQVNLFVLDEPAMEATRKSNSLTFSSYYRLPQIDYQSQGIIDSWDTQLVTLSDLTFDCETYKPYVVSYYDKKLEANKALAQWQEDNAKRASEEREHRQREAEQERIKGERDEQSLREAEKLKKEQSELAKKTWLEAEEKRREEDRRKNEELILKLEARKIENRCPKEFSEMAARDCIDLIFGEEYASRNINNIRNRIYELQDMGFNFPINVLQEIEKRGWIKKMAGNFTLINYERG